MPNTIKGVEIDPFREKLIELITNKENDLMRKIAWFPDTYRIKEVANHLIANGVTVQRWIPVTERLPEADAGKVLCITQAGHYKILQWIETFDCWSDPFGIDFTNFRNGYVAYWMPCPNRRRENDYD